MMRQTFLKDCQTGVATPSDIEDYVDRWHGEPVDERSLAEYLGFSALEYSKWLADASTVAAIVAAHQTPQ